MNIDLQIERLVLDGLTIAPGDVPKIKAAVETELARLLADGETASGLRGGDLAAASLRAGSIQLESGSGPQQLGVQIARTVHESLQAGGRPGATRQQEVNRHGISNQAG